MNLSKKSLSFLLPISLIISLPLVVPKVYAQTPQIYFEPTLLTLDNVGDSGSVEIKISGATNISGYEFHFDFDPQAIRVDGVEILDAPSGVSIIPLGPEIDNENGSVAAGVLNYGGKDILTGATAALVRINLTTLKEGTTNLSFTDAMLTDTNFESLAVTTSNGSVRTGTPSDGEGIPLHSGGNRVIWPEGLGDFTSLSALESIADDCGGAGAISRKRGGWWESAVYGRGGVNFALSAGNAVYIRVASGCVWSP